MLECAVNNLQQTFLNEFVIWLALGVIALAAGTIGIFVEDHFDLIGGKKKKGMVLNRNFLVALDCVVEAEKQLVGPGRGKEKFSWAVEQYTRLTGERDPNKVFEMVTKAFNASSLCH